MGKAKHQPVNEYEVMQKINRKVAYRLRHWGEYFPGIFTGSDCYSINNAFDELCVLYKNSSLYEIPFGDSMLPVISAMLEDVCSRLTREEKRVLANSYKEICFDEEDNCKSCNCVACESFNDYLVREFEQYLADYTSAKIDEAVYG